MKQYIWINPVVWSMHDGEELTRVVSSLGYDIIQCKGDYIKEVKAKYNNVLKNNSGCVMDMRCPGAVSYVRGKYPDADVFYPDIEPILIHCARELSVEYGSKNNARVTIITPCSELRDYGSGKKLHNTVFLTWTEFKAMHGIDIKRMNLEKSPIPPGFFREAEESGISLTDREKLEQFFENEKFKNFRIAEMLYCTDGCHNGNGV